MREPVRQTKGKTSPGSDGSLRVFLGESAAGELCSMVTGTAFSCSGGQVHFAIRHGRQIFNNQLGLAAGDSSNWNRRTWSETPFEALKSSKVKPPPITAKMLIAKSNIILK
jgi:hypothetical protein